MSARVEYNYPRAPITVTTTVGQTLDFEVTDDGSGDVMMMVTVEERYDLSISMREIWYRISTEDWAAVVAHVRKDQEG